MSNVLVIGSGAREHALAWKLSQSSAVKHVYVAPGNAGTHATGKISHCDVNVKDHADIVLRCESNNIDLVVVGPEDPLANGLADHLKSTGLKCFGPCQKAAQIEASKEFAKFFMDKYEIPTARWKSFTNAQEAKDHIANAPYDALVVKASGLAAGKGVIVGKNKEEAIKAVDTLKQDTALSSASDTIVIEELLSGEEVSVLCFSDGTHISVMPPAQDHKRLLDNDEGPNTGGMGAYCRCPLLSDADMAFIKENVLQKTIDGMRKEGSPYIGVLYAGLMLTKDGPKVLEFNCRFGDPETQVILPLLETDIYTVFLACVDGKLDSLQVEWSKDKFAVGIVVVSGGYPGSYEKGKLIRGLEKLGQNYILFHAGSAIKSGSLVTSGGRVITVVSVCNSLEDAIAEAHLGAGYVNFEGAFFRSDIGKKGLVKLHPQGMTYKASGVDIESGDNLVRKIKDLTKETLRKEVQGGIGGFGGIFELSGYVDPYLISKVGNIGKKLKTLQDCRKYAVIGLDLVAESVNELLCYGAETLFFLDTYTCGKLDVEVAAEVITGIAKGCKEANCALIGGETAEMPGMYHNSVFDLTSFSRGAVEKSRLLPHKKDISPGDIAIGLLTNCVNANAFRMAERLMAKKDLSFSDVAPFDPKQTLEEALLIPHKIYVRSLLPLLRKGLIKAATFLNTKGIAGHAQEILPGGCNLVLDGSTWSVPPVFDWIAANADLSRLDMLKEFNCGIAFILIVNKGVSEEILEHLKASNAPAVAIGSIGVCDKDESLIKVVKSVEVMKTPMLRRKVAILTSNKGTNLKALVHYTQNSTNLSSAHIAVVVSNRNDVSLESAKTAKIPIEVIDMDGLASEEMEGQLNKILNSHNVEIICLDYFSKELSPNFLREWKGKILTIHPSLLPAFHSCNAHQDALSLGVRLTGCTVYCLEEEGLAGKIIDQAAIPIEITDTVEILEQKVAHLQHLIYPQALELFVSGKSSGKVAFQSGDTFSDEDEHVQKMNEDIRSLMNSTARPGFESSAELSCGVFDLKASGYQFPYLISGTDGVGTKLKIAQICNKHDTIGIDLVAMCVNDILTHGAEPLFFMECFDCGKIKEETVKSVVSGIAEGCKQAMCALIGTEVNELPDIYLKSSQCLHDLEKYDVVGYAEGALRKENLLPRLDDINDGDVLIGVSSSGVHSNGYSLIRKLVQVKNLRYQDPFPLDTTKTLQDVLLEPTKIYVKSLLPLIQKGYVKAAAHITGGGLTENIPRVLPSHLGVVLNGDSWKLPPVLQWIAMEGQLSKSEMLRTFNCGLGMVLIVEKKREKEVLELLKNAEETAATVGYVRSFNKGDEKVEVRNFQLAISSVSKKKKKVGVLISGSGTNLQSLIDYTQDPNNCSAAEIVLVLSNVAGVKGLERAQKAGIPTKVLSHKDFKKRVEFDMAVHAILKESGVEIVCLAGFMRIVSKEFVQLWQGNLLNVHPALLPSFKGMNAHRQAIELGAKITGCTVHFVEAEVDAGAIIEQAAERIDPDDDETSLQEKVKLLEHKIFPAALELLASGRVSRDTNGKLKWHF